MKCRVNVARDILRDAQAELDLLPDTESNRERRKKLASMVRHYKRFLESLDS